VQALQAASLAHAHIHTPTTEGTPHVA